MIRDRILTKLAEEISYDEVSHDPEFDEPVEPERDMTMLAEEKALKLRRGQAVKLMKALIGAPAV